MSEHKLHSLLREKSPKDGFAAAFAKRHGFAVRKFCEPIKKDGDRRPRDATKK